MPSILRTMKPGDIPSVRDLPAIANWNQTPDDWRRILQLSANGCRVIEEDGRIVSTVSLVPYGTRLAWIGMLITRSEHRLQGFARRLMEDAIARAEWEGIRTLKLDATDEGRPLYESLGFVVEGTVERWSRDAGEFAAVKENSGAAEDAGNGPSNSVRISNALFSLDAKAFGAAREALLLSLAKSGECTATAEGYALARPGRTAHYLGPCVATSEAEAGRLIAVRLESSENFDKQLEEFQACSWYWDLLPANPGAVRCAQSLGFTRHRILWRMRRGETIENNNALVYAIAGFELG